MKIKVDYDLCEANAICMKVAPELFQVDDNDELNVLNEAPGEELRAKLQECVRRCPRQAIAIED
jgi:ferredoxin